MKNSIKKLLSRIKENYQSNKIVLLVLCILWAILVATVLLTNKDIFGKESYGNELYENVHELTKNDTVKQAVEIVENSDVVAVKLATYARKNEGDINIRVVGLDSKTEYANKSFNVNFVQDNAFVTVSLSEPLKADKDKTIEVILSSNCEEKKALGVYYSNDKVFEQSTLTINSAIKEGDLTLRFLYPEETLQAFNTMMLTWVLVSFTFIVFLILFVKPKLEVLFTIIAIVFGLTFCIIITPMSVPDETAHYEYAFQMSNKMMGIKNYKFFNEAYQNYGDFGGHRNVSAAYKRLMTKFNRPLSLKNSLVYMSNDIAESYKTCFIPQGLGVTVARLLNLNMLKTFYLGRLFNLAFYVLCVYLAVKITPIHKILFGMLATLPMFMQQAASFSYDCFVNGLSFVLIALIIKWMAVDERISKKDFILAVIVTVLLSPIKVIYGLFAFLFWFVPADRFGDHKKKIIGTIILTIPTTYEILVLFYPFVAKIFTKLFENIQFARTVYAYDTQELITSKNMPLGEGTPDHYHFAYILDHLSEIFDLVYRTIRYNIKTWFYGAFGRILSGYTLILPSELVHSTLLVVLLAAIKEEYYVESIPFKVATFIIAVIGGMMALLGMLISWTDVEQVVIEDFGGPMIQGVQGRYFSPFLPYIFTILNNKKIRIPKKIDVFIQYAQIVVTLLTVVYVLTFTYIN